MIKMYYIIEGTLFKTRQTTNTSIVNLTRNRTSSITSYWK